MGPTISLCMIVKDEAELLPACLHSVRDLVDEIVICDTGSSDATLKIATDAGAKVLQVPWKDDFSHARNQTLALATSDWILILDADETMTPESIPILRKAMHDDGHVGYSLNVRSEFEVGKSIDATILRFFRNHSSIRFRNPIHEQVYDSVVQYATSTQRRIGHLPVDILHRGYEKERFEKRKKRERNERLLRKQCKQDPKDLYSHHKLVRHLESTNGHTDEWAEEVQKAHRLLHAPREFDRNRKKIYAAEICSDYCLLLEEQGDVLAAFAHYQEMASLVPRTINFTYNHGRVALASNEIGQSIDLFQQTIDGTAGEIPARLGVQEHLGHHALAVAFSRENRSSEAKEALKNALIYKQDYSPSLELLASLRGEFASQSQEGFEQPIQPKNTERILVNEERRQPDQFQEPWSTEAKDALSGPIMEWHAVFMPFFDSCRSILDIGSGNGMFLEIVRAANKEGLGIDISQEIVDASCSRGLDVRLQDFKEGLPAGPFDGIHACHVLEYLTLPELYSFLTSCHQALSPGGTLLLRTSNLENSDVRDKIFWKDEKHIRAYPLDVLKGCLTELGFEIAEKGVENGSFNDIFVVARRAAAAQFTKSPTAPSVSTKAPRVVWEGSQFVSHSLARVNRELTLALLDTGKCELSVAPFEPHSFGAEVDERFEKIQNKIYALLSGPVDHHVRHQWPPNFAPPREGKWITYQPWEYGAIPKSWLEPLRSQVDEIWVPSQSVREGMVASGVPEEKVHVISNGVNPLQFRPEASPKSLPYEGTFRFLFVGGTIWRKGIDVLLNAFTSAFTERDNVSLVIKEVGKDTSYKNQVMDERIRKIAQSGQGPKIVYLEEQIAEEDLPGLYTACDCLVHPFRGEGFALPVVEAAACGLPVVVTDGGPCNNYLDRSMAYFIPSEKKNCSVDLELCVPGWIHEPNLQEFTEILRSLPHNHAEAKKKASAAAKHVRTQVTWATSASQVLERLGAAPPSSPKLAQKSEASRDQIELQSEQTTDVIARLKQSVEELLKKASSPSDREAFPEIDSVLAEAYRSLARLYYQETKYTEAKNELRRALELEPSNTSDRMMLGNAELLNGDPNAAIKTLEQAISQEPSNPTALYNLALAHRCNNQLEQAASYFEKAIHLGESSSEVHNNLGVTLFDLGKVQQAKKHLEQALQMEPSSLDAGLNLAQLEQHDGDSTSALKRLLHLQRFHAENIELKREISALQKDATDRLPGEGTMS